MMGRVRERRARHLGTLGGAGMIAAWICLAGCATTPVTSGPMVAGEGTDGPWWMQQTSLTSDGHLDLRDQSWWPRATELEVGQRFEVEAEGEAAGRMLVRRERFRNRSREVEAIVWVIDDDADGSIRTGGDEDSDCYVVDYDCDGTVDRMVDYIDDDGDNDPDEMDIRYFVDGNLRQVWCGHDLDDDSAMWSLRGYEYGGPSFFESDPYGDSLIHMNKFDPTGGRWVPISECPFAFYDTDKDRYSEVVVRVSAVPLTYDASIDPDYANDARRYRGAWSENMQRMGIVNIRYSFDVDNVSSKEMPLHFDFGFNLVGAAPYEFKGMHHFNPKRRPPQVTCVIPHSDLRGICDRYEAREAGFTWHEQHDDTIAIGYGPHEAQDFRWEGVFWIWERRFMENTGGPGQKWNVRREWSRRKTDRRELYYSEVDRRIHLYGAEEGWIQIGHFGGGGVIGEMRMSDTDGNGYFDRWEVYLGDSLIPVRVTTVRDERTRPVVFDDEKITQFYTQEVLPEAMAANTRLIGAMSKVRPFAIPADLREAMNKGSLNHQRFAQDVLRELQYQDLRQHFTKRAHEVLRDAKMDDLRYLDAEQRRSGLNSQTAWQLIRLLEQLDVSYGQGDYEQAGQHLSELVTLKELWAE